jgi:hypothetical protein
MDRSNKRSICCPFMCLRSCGSQPRPQDSCEKQAQARPSLGMHGSCTVNMLPVP